jgi:2,4-diaminopentanoate dehydrogenase
MTYRVIQWAPGAVGGLCLQQIIDDPSLELAGLYVYSEHKEGRDAGELVDRPATGIRATRDRDAVIATEADVVLYTPLSSSLQKLDDDVEALLSSGKNVISTATYFAPEFRGPEVVERLTRACHAGNTTLFGTGIEPGFMFDRVAPTLTGLCTEVDHLRLVELVDATNHPAASTLIDALGIGGPASEVHGDTPFGRYFAAFFSEMATGVARNLGVTLSKLETGLEPATATQDLDIVVGHVKRGTVVAVKHTVAGYVGDQRFLDVEVYWSCERGAGGWPIPPDRYQWTIEIEGKPSIRSVFDTLTTLDPAGDLAAYDPAFHATMAAAVNAIPDVCTAPAGLMHAPVFAPWRPPKLSG